MNSKRSMWKLLVGMTCVGLLVTNCTIKSASDDDANGCEPGHKKNCSACDNDVTGSQTCQDDGTYGDCVCPGSVNGGGSNGGAANTAGASTNGGASYTAGYGGMTSNGGAAPAAAGEGGEGGATEPVVFATCLDCLDARCANEYAACDADPTCISTDLDGTGQYERIAACIDKERIKGVVRRDVVRGCGVTIGANANPDFISDWAPEGMADTTTNLLNCMADAPGAEPASWANDDRNFPIDGNDMINPTPWAEGTCAKDACASAL